MPDLRMYFVGTHDCGKSTLARYYAQKLNLPLITEVARQVLTEMEVGFERLRADLALVNTYQKRVFLRQMDIEEKHSGGVGFVSDRSFDNLAYAAEHATILHELVALPAFVPYMKRVSEGRVFFIRPQPTIQGADGVRERRDWDALCRIDGMVKLLLEMYKIPYCSISCSGLQERIRTIDAALAL